MKHEFVEFETRELASAHATLLISGGLGRAIEDSGRASLMVSGGTAPILTFEALSHIDLPWSRVTVGLVDERWVGLSDEGSNERLVRERLLTGLAGAAGFVPMKTMVDNVEAAVADRNLAYISHCDPLDVIILGMGNDGHTASWYPESKGLALALQPSDGSAISAIDATGCAVAGDLPHRMTLTGPAVVGAKLAVLLLFGDEKRRVFESSFDLPVMERPIRHAVDKLGPRLTVIWAP